MSTDTIKTERFEMRMEASLLAKIDKWRASELDVPSRAEAIRRLVSNSLDRKSLQLDGANRLIVAMLCDLAKALKVDGEINHDLVSASLYGGHLWGIEWHMGSLFDLDQDSHEEVYYVVDVLNMWRFIERSYEELNNQEKNIINQESSKLGISTKFFGFDGNEETQHFSIALFLIEKMDRFSEFKGRDLNSHWPTKIMYRNMLSKFNDLKSKLVGRQLSRDELILVLKASSIT